MADRDASSTLVQTEAQPVESKKSRSRAGSIRARSQARRCVMQALYQWQLTQQTFSEILAQFIERNEYKTADASYFHALLSGSIEHQLELSARIGEFADRPWAQLDPIERAILLIGMYELLHCPEVPYRVVVNEAVELTKQFGATDGYKYINALLDRVARVVRAGERQHSRH